jgi:hypothetical protein
MEEKRLYREGGVRQSSSEAIMGKTQGKGLRWARRLMSVTLSYSGGTDQEDRGSKPAQASNS